MLTSLIAMSVVADKTAPRIVTASLFKNGFAVVTREIDAPKPGEYSVDTIPQGSLGTLWFTTTDGTQLDSVVTTTNTSDVRVPVGTIDGILRANVGKQLRLGVRNGDAVVSDQAVGTLVAADGDVVIVKSEKGTLVLPKAQITSIALAADQGELLYSTAQKQESRALRFRVSGRPGKIVMFSLERGLTWAPGYAVDITDKKKLSLVAKSTLLNDLGELDNVEARFITGFPNVPFANYVDPLVSGQDVNAFTSLVSSIGGPGGQLGQVGGFSGGRAGDMMTQNAYAPRLDLQNLGTSMPNNPLVGDQKEDLFFYRQPNVRLKRGDRGYYTLFRMESPYEEIYCWDMDDQTQNNVEYRPLPSEPGEVWHALQFKNTSGQPLTTGAATTFQGGEVVGQDLMKYVPPGGQAELRINKSLNLRAEAEEFEVSRERGAIKQPNGYPIFDLVTLKGILAIGNAKDEKVKLRIRKDLTGEIVDAEGQPETTKTAKGLTQVNPVVRLVWNKELEPRKTLKLTYSYKLYVRTAN